MKNKNILFIFCVLLIISVVYAVVSLTVTISPAVVYSNYVMNGNCSVSGLNGNIQYNYTWYKNNVINYSSYYNYTNTTCYQETATSSTSCGGLATGVYSHLNTQSSKIGPSFYVNYSKPLKAVQGSKWLVSSGADGVKNYTIPQDCWNFYPSTIRLRLLTSPTTYVTSVNTQVNISCWNGAWKDMYSYRDCCTTANGYADTTDQWTRLYDGNWTTGAMTSYYGKWFGTILTTKAAFYEEAMYWQNGLKSIINPPAGSAWILSCKAKNSTASSLWTNSTSRSIRDVPTVRKVNLTPTYPYTNTTKLKGYCNATDSTNSTLKFYYKWYKNNTLNASGSKNAIQNLLNNLNNITSFAFNQSWKFSCLGSDGTTNSSWLNSTAVIIHGLPSITSATITPTVVYKNDTLKAYCNSTDLDTSNLKIYWKWYKNTILNQSGSKNVTINLLVNIANKTGMLKNQNWVFSCRASDGTVNSSWTNSSTKTISDYQPAIPTLQYPTNNLVIYVKNSTLNYTSSDIDNDTITYYVYLSTSNPPLTINYTGTSKNRTLKNLPDGTRYYWKVIAGDGTKNSSNSSIYTFYVSWNKPAINIISPVNNQWITKNLSYVNFSFTATDTKGVKTCKLYTNTTGTWKVNKTNSSMASGVLTKFYLNLPTEKIYKYNLWCNNTNGLSTYYPYGNITFGTDNITPLMTVTSPLQGQTYTGGTTPLTMLATDTYLSYCDFTIYDTPTLTQLSYGTANCTGTTTMSTPAYAPGYTVKIKSYDLAGNSKTVYRNFTAASAPVVPPSSGGGGGSVVLSNKRPCKIIVSPANISFSNAGTKEITVKNEDSVTYAPSIDTKTDGISANSVYPTNFFQTILANKQSSFGIKYTNGENVEGSFKVTLIDLNCNDIVIRGTIGKTQQQTNIIETLLSGGIMNFLLEDINSTLIKGFAVWMLYVGVIFLLFAATFTPVSDNFAHKKYVIVLLWVVLNFALSVLITIPIVMLIRGG